MLNPLMKRPIKIARNPIKLNEPGFGPVSKYASIQDKLREELELDYCPLPDKVCDLASK